MNTTLRSFLLGLVVATFSLVVAVLVGTIALDAFDPTRTTTEEQHP